MKNRSKIIVLVSGILAILLIVAGITFAIFTYGRTGTNQELVLGDIWMKYTEVNGITLEEAMPGDLYSKYFQFTITGTNTYTKKDIYYDISLVKGEVPEGKEETNRIEDKYLKFKLVEVNGDIETEIFTDKTYDSLANQRIHVETIPKSTSTYSKTYRLYMVISEDLKVGNGSEAVISNEDFQKLFGSVKVNVTGDFNEKSMLTYEDCFETTTRYDGTLEITDYSSYDAENPLCTSDVVIPSSINGIRVTSIGENAFYSKHLSSLEIPNSVTSIANGAFNSNVLPDNQAFIYARTDANGDGVAEIDTTTLISCGQGDYEGVVVIPNNVITIGSRAFKGCDVKSITFPDSVKYVESRAFEGLSLYGNVNLNLNKVEEVGDFAFQNASSSSFGSLKIQLPSVKKIGFSSFSNGDLEEISIGNTIEDISISAFAGGGLREDGWKLSIDKTCEEIRNIPFYDYDNDEEFLYYPWLSNEEPYYEYYEDSELISVTISGSNSEVCETIEYTPVEYGGEE